MTEVKVFYFSGEIPQGDPEGDQRDLFQKFRLLCKERKHAILASFLEIVTSAVKSEFARLGKTQKDSLPSFESVLDLTHDVVRLRKTTIGGSIERVLVLVFQLGNFIAYHEAHPLGQDYQTPRAFLLARGTGLLSAAAISFSPNLSTIPELAEHVIKIAFRSGLVIDQVCRTLEVSQEDISDEGAWVYCVHGTSEGDSREAVDQFNAKMGYPRTNQASVFKIDDQSVSIRGPPSTLRALFAECELFLRTKNVPMKKIQGMWHTATAYGKSHVQQAVPKINTSHEMILPLFSPVTGKPFQSLTYAELCEMVTDEIFAQGVHWDLAIEGITERLKQESPDAIKLVRMKPTNDMENLVNTWRKVIPSATVSTYDAMSTVMDLSLGKSPPRNAQSQKIAVVGMGCRFPDGADDTEKFWELLMRGHDAHTTVPADRFNVETHVDPGERRHNTSKTPYGCFVNNPGLFDALFFGISPREAEQTDPIHRLALVTAYEALESAGYVHGRGIHARRVGTFYGQASDDYREVNTSQDIGTYFIPGGCRAFASGRINYFFKFWGPSFSVDTACSSSLAAIQAACTSLWSGDVDMAVAGGLNIITNSDLSAGLSRGHFLSPTGGCKTWDENADGYCRADGVGSIVLKRLEDAEADNDNILAVVLSAATDHSAEAVSITHPHDVAQAHLYNQVIRRAGVDPLAVGYVEMHGTGTQAGDKMEMKSVTSVFAPHKNRPLPLHIGTVKSNFGHGEAAAGIMAFIKTTLVFQKGVIPPHVGIKTRFNPNLPDDLAERGVIIPDQGCSWNSDPKRTRIAMVNNFGAAGGNTSIIMEEAPQRPKTCEDPRPTQVITVSAKTAFSLQQNLERLIRYIENEPELSLADLAYTLSARRTQYNYRVAVVANSPAEAACLLRPHILSSMDQTAHSGKQPPIAFAFTGQGVFYLKIGAQLYRDTVVFRQQIDQLDDLAQRQGFSSFMPIITGKCEPKDTSTVPMHLAILCVEIALARLWESYGIRPGVIVGHSLGEYAALTIAGVLSDSAAIYLVGVRASLLDANCSVETHGMLSVRASVGAIQQASDGIPFEVSCVNGREETVIGGSVASLDALSDALAAAGYKATKLDVAHAYHTSQMEAISDQFIQQTRGVTCKKPRLPIISPMYARMLTPDDAVDVSYLAAATLKTVDFAGALDAAWQSGAISDLTVWLEIGHHPICCGFVTRTLPTTRLVCPSLRRDNDDWTIMNKSLCALYNNGVNIDWNEYHRPFEEALRLVDAPTYAWNNKNHWIQYRGDWNLTKGRDGSRPAPTKAAKGFSTTSIHQLDSEISDGSKAEIVAETNITDRSLAGVVDGHAMNNHGVASSFLHADMAFTMAERFRDKWLPSSVPAGISVEQFEYHEPVVKLLDTSKHQPITVSTKGDLDGSRLKVDWFNPAKQLWYCHATVTFHDPSTWLSDWARSAKLVSSRIDALLDMASRGQASKLTTDLAYALFGKLVKYSPMYHNMQWVILNDDEAVAEVVLPPDPSGTWTVPPHFIDGCVSLSGFILNGGTFYDNVSNFYVTPSWKSMRFARPLAPGGRYLAYVRMVPSGSGRRAYAGDVYIMQDGEVVGLVEAILFREWPRVMLNRFFTPPDAATAAEGSAPRARAPSPPSRDEESDAPISTPVSRSEPPHSGTSRSTSPESKPRLIREEASGAAGSSVVERALELVAEELAVDRGQLTDDTDIADLGLDSLMSLVLSQRLREELGIEIRDAFFLEVSTVAELKKMIS